MGFQIAAKNRQMGAHGLSASTIATPLCQRVYRNMTAI